MKNEELEGEGVDELLRRVSEDLSDSANVRLACVNPDYTHGEVRCQGSSSCLLPLQAHCKQHLG